MKTTTEPLKAPFPYPGGKSRVADLVWSRLGNVDNFVEPFAGSLAVLLRRPADHFAGGYRVETANDANHYLVNFWRAVRAAPEAVAEHADWPVTEADLHARHKWLVRSEHAAGWRAKMAADPEHYDAKVAGWWVWGQCCWIGGAWCAHKIDQNNMPLLDPSQKGINRGATEHKRQRPGANQDGRGYGVNRDCSDQQKMPKIGHGTSVGNAVAGTHVHGDHGGRPQLADAFDIGRGVNGHATAGTCEARRAWLVAWMRRLADRLRLVRTCYGHWSRVCDSDSTLTRLGTTGVFLDPPYPERSVDGKKSRDASLYATDRGADLDALRDEVLAWCRKWGSDPAVRVAVCGYEGDGYEPLLSEGWTEHAWEASGGYANQRRGGKGKAENAKRERIWFSPACLKDDAGPSLFDVLEDA